MKLTKHKLGKFFAPYSEKCNNPNLTADSISGINREKEFFEPSNQVGEDTSKYKVVPPKYFACNLMHVGRDRVLPIAYNHTQKNKIVSPAYFVFKIIENNYLDELYFFMMLKSEERDRYFWFHTDASIRDGMTWEDLCDVEITLPPIEIQQKYVNIYNAMVENQKSYESGLEDLKLTCDAYIEELRRNTKTYPIKDYIEETNERNSDGLIKTIKGVENTGQFIKTKANMNGIDISNYKVVRKNNFAYNPSRINLGSIALLSEDAVAVSPMYITFKTKKALNPEYLMLWLCRKEFQRSTLFYASGSVRDTFDFEMMQEVKIPIPDIPLQDSISMLYKVFTKRKAINEYLKHCTNDICSVLIKGSLQEN